MADRISDPMGMRFLLPEHVSMLIEHDYVKTLVPQPILDDQEMQELNYTMMESIHNDSSVTIQWWRQLRDQLGDIQTAWGWIQRIDPTLRQVKLVNDEDVWYIQLNRLVSVREGRHE